MIIQPKFRGFICTTAHPLGCAQNVDNQINYVKGQGPFNGPKNVLIIGASTGYGLASRIALAFGAKARTLGVFYERPASGIRTATAGWYNTAAFEQRAKAENIYARSINGDAFSHEIKEETIEAIRADLGTIDLIIYSLASPRRIDPLNGETYSSVIKPIGKPFEGKTVDFHSGRVSKVKIEPATESEIAATIKVMGGEDWILWLQALKAADVLKTGCTTIAYSYIGPKLTHAIYKDGTIGKAKEDLETSAAKLNQMLASIDGRAYISINKALVTQSSAAIPVVPLYISLLYQVMKAMDIHEDCIEQAYRLFGQQLNQKLVPLDAKGRIRIDDWEMRPDVQKQVIDLWDRINSENVESISDLAGFKEGFFKLFGFGFSEIDYTIDTEPQVSIESINRLD